MKFLAVLLLCAVSAVTNATPLATVETHRLQGAGMSTQLTVKVMLPTDYRASAKRYPVVFFLHGAGGSPDFMTGEVERTLCEKYGVIGVAPDGTKFGWWWDSPEEPERRIESFVTETVVPWVDRTYRTQKRRERRAIVGESMGGHGACWIGFRHRDLFGAVGNVYGGVDVRPFEGKWEIAKRLGPQTANPARWREHCAITEAEKLRNGDIALMTVVGTNDIFLEPNRRMHEVLAKNNVAHWYLEIRGATEELSSHTHPFRWEGEKIVLRFIAAFFAGEK